MGLAMTPPTSIANTVAGSIPLPPTEARREPDATMATATSAVFTEPMANRGATPRWSRKGVTTGPHAPTSPLVIPPVAAATLVARLSKSN